MKKIIVLLLVTFAVFGCSEELEFNTPSFQAEKDGNLWEAFNYYATVDANGVITITGSDSFESITLTAFPNDSFVCLGNENTVYPSEPGLCYNLLTTGNNSFATLTDIDNTIYSTNNIPDLSNQIYPSDGEINIREGGLEAGFISGKFHFNAYNGSGLTSVNVSEGFFHNIPFTSGETQTYFTCLDAQDAADAALVAFNAVGTLDAAAYEQACNVYRDAIQAKINLCGDPNGEFQDIIDVLNAANCQISCDDAINNSQIGLNAYNSATIGNVIERCTTYTQYLNEQIMFCGDSDGSIQALIDALDCNDDDGDGIANTFEDLNNNGDYTDDDTDNDGTPDYLDTDDDGDGVDTANELMLDADGNPMDTDGDATPDYLDTDDDGDGILTQYESGDTDGDGVPDYLDIDDDGDSVFTIFENPDPNGDGNPDDAIDTDADGTPDYLDDDDDGDGIPTIDENPDPNGDGNPNDAVDTNMNGTPDYLDAT